MGNINIGRIVTLGAKKQPNKECLVFGKNCYTYQKLNNLANKLASSLIDLGIQKGDRVGIILNNCLEWFDIVFASAKLGAAIVPVNLMFTPPEIKYILEDSGTRWVFVGEEHISKVMQVKNSIKEVKKYIYIGQKSYPGFLNFSQLEEQGKLAEPEVEEVKADDLFLLQYTSGTTGFPKGAMHTHGTTYWNAIMQIIDFSMRSDEVYLIMPSLSWAAGLNDFTYGVLILGGTNHLMPTGRLDLDDLLNRIEKNRITFCIFVPTVIRMLIEYANLKAFDLSSLRCISTGGEALLPVTIGRFLELLPNVPLFQAFGLSEGPTIATLLPVERGKKKLGCSGRPGVTVEIMIADPDDKPLKAGEVGEVCIKAPACMIGYWNRPEASAETLKGGWLHTGDLGRWDEEGDIYVVGRKKDMFISGGLNVYPPEIENILVKYPKVSEAAVIGIPDPKWGEVGRVYITVRSGESITIEELLDFCRESLASYKVPKQYIISSKPLPRTVSGKIQKYLLKENMEL